MNINGHLNFQDQTLVDQVLEVGVFDDMDRSQECQEPFSLGPRVM